MVKQWLQNDAEKTQHGLIEVNGNWLKRCDKATPKESRIQRDSRIRIAAKLSLVAGTALEWLKYGGNHSKIIHMLLLRCAKAPALSILWRRGDGAAGAYALPHMDPLDECSLPPLNCPRTCVWEGLRVCGEHITPENCTVYRCVNMGETLSPPLRRVWRRIWCKAFNEKRRSHTYGLLPLSLCLSGAAAAAICTMRDQCCTKEAVVGQPRTHYR